ncbi:hypothetical protein SG34_010565 [Thalassomonas viridans]|uniref:Mu-like prophage FluMu N-terminal domain-containing protein n=1 Tax=Thalassomonas viridans TaxID=137584 RepID=A0AAF0CAV7_9GAMM|nr:HI1506-related protein [Thalassomonas viridans]WDE07288.1 hypothetical protein SG34_010565 [Thalassomonas viridans]
MNKLSKVAVSVMSSMHNGYRRAGYAFDTGKNNLPAVTRAELDALEADTNLVVNVLSGNALDESPAAVVARAQGSAPSGDVLLEAGNVANEDRENLEEVLGPLEKEFLNADPADVEVSQVDVNITDAPAELLPFILAIAEMRPANKPNCNILEVEIPGEDGEEAIKLKPTSAQRDAAWEWYSKNASKVNITKAVQ